MVETITFGFRSSANAARDELPDNYLAESDDRRERTVRLSDDAPEDVVNRLSVEALGSEGERQESYDQAELTRSEKQDLDFSREGVNAIKVRWAKGIAVQEGVDDWRAYFDPTLTVDELAAVYANAAQESGGRRGTGSISQEQRTRQQASRAERAIGQMDDRLLDAALVDRDPDAQDELDRPDAPAFDISYSRGEFGPQGRGADFNRLLDRHEQRTQRAQSVDEQRQAPVTRDPVEWTNNPSAWDFPDIDTIDPMELHRERSPRARERDNDQLAEVTTDREKWATSPDEYDFPNVDTPDGWEPASRDEVLDTSGLGEQRGLGGGVAEQDTQASFDVAADDSPDTRLAEERASEFGVDDRTDAGRGVDRDPIDVDDPGLEAFGGGSRTNRTLDDL